MLLDASTTSAAQARAVRMMQLRVMTAYCSILRLGLAQ